MESTIVRRSTWLSLYRGLAIGIFAVAALAGTHSLAQSVPLARPTAHIAPPVPAAGLSDTAGTQEPLKVHGQWKIVVKNADGSTASTTEFENSLIDSGFLLTRLLLGSAVTGSWGIFAGASSVGTSPCGGSTPYCVLVPSTTSAIAPGICTGFTCYGGLTYTVSANAFQLVGSFTATQAGSITTVQTAALACYAFSTSTTTPTTVTPSTCSTSLGNSNTVSTVSYLTSATAPAFSPVGVSVGQVVQITVAISFS